MTEVDDTNEKTRAEPEPEPEQPQFRLNRKQRRALIASERRKLCLGRDGGSGNWIPRPRARAAAARREKIRAEKVCRSKTAWAAHRLESLIDSGAFDEYLSQEELVQVADKPIDKAFTYEDLVEAHEAIMTQSRERNDNAREEADALGHPIHQGQLAEEL